MPRQLVPNSKLPQRYGVTRECLFRWKMDAALDFPKAALVIKGREFFDEEDLLAWEESRREEVAA